MGRESQSQPKFCPGRRALRRLIAVLGLGWTCLLPAQSVDISDSERRGVSLVLSGGGARGLAHVGVLQVLEELRVPVDCVVGTSMGALIGGMYAAGVRPQSMQEVLESTNIDALFVDPPPRSQIPQRVKRDDYKALFDITFGFNDGSVQLPEGASAGYKVELFLREQIGPGASVGGLHFDDLPMPYRAVATDLETGKMKVFDSGDLARVMRASMSLPAILAPIEIDGRTYVDGGLVRNLPVDVAKSLCGDVVIAVNLGTPLKRLEQLGSVVGVAGQAMNLLTEQNVERSLAELDETDILIEPDLTGISSTDFAAAKYIVERGAKAARARSHVLRDLSVSEAVYAQWLAERQSRRLTAPAIVAIEITPSERFGTEAIERDLDVEPGEDFSYEKLHGDLVRLFGRGDFSYIGYSIVDRGDGGVVVIDAQPKPWGPGYLKFGLSTRTDFDSPAQANLAASYRRTWANSLGAEWRVDAQIGHDSLIATEFLQPLQVRDGAFVAPYAGAQRAYIQIYSEDLRLGQLRIGSVSGGVDFGLTGTLGEFRLGPYVSAIRTSPDVGILTPGLPREEVTQIGLKVSGVIDRLDSVTFARSGWFAAVTVRAAETDWGSEDQFQVGRLATKGVKSFGKHTVALHAEWGEQLSGELPSYERFQLGGPGRLSGLFLDQLTGTKYNLGTLTYYARIGDMPTQIGRGTYAGISIEAGRIDDPLMEDPWDWVSAGSVFLGADTILGALYVGYGYSSLGQGSAYLTIGHRL